MNCVQQVKHIYDSVEEEKADYLRGELEYYTKELKYQKKELKVALYEIDHAQDQIDKLCKEYLELTGEIYD